MTQAYSNYSILVLCLLSKSLRMSSR